MRIRVQCCTQLNGKIRIGRMRSFDGDTVQLGKVSARSREWYGHWKEVDELLLSGFSLLSRHIQIDRHRRRVLEGNPRQQERAGLSLDYALLAKTYPHQAEQ